jgi:hypothetical protein
MHWDFSDVVFEQMHHDLPTLLVTSCTRWSEGAVHSSGLEGVQHYHPRRIIRM